MIELSKRLGTIVGFIDKNKKVADIGTDHGFVPNFIVNEKISDFVISSDISKNSILKSIELTKEYNNEDKIINRIGPGLEVLNVSEVDIAIIAGMGGLLISEIIKDSWDIAINLDKLILQPMQAKKELRKFLVCNGFQIIDEKIVFEDRKYFEIIVARYTGENTKKEDIFFEIPEIPYNRKDEIVYSYLENRIEYNEILIDNLKKSCDLNKVDSKIKEVKKFINNCKELLNEI